MSTSQLGYFLADLALNAKARKAFDEDPDTAMARVNLSPEEQDVLRTGELATILEYLDEGGIRPADPDRATGSGSGTGGGGGGSGSGGS